MIPAVKYAWSVIVPPVGRVVRPDPVAPRIELNSTSSTTGITTVSVTARALRRNPIITNPV